MSIEPIVNRVAESDIEVFDLDALWDGGSVTTFDLAPYLFEGIILKEKDFRTAMKALDWASFEGQHVAITCTADAIIPTWAYMLVSSKLQNIARSVGFGEPADIVRDYYVRALNNQDWSPYENKITVIKGCSSKTVPMNAYLMATQKLQSVARKIMYGEPCSSVPLWRKPKN